MSSVRVSLDHESVSLGRAGVASVFFFLLGLGLVGRGKGGNRRDRIAGLFFRLTSQLL